MIELLKKHPKGEAVPAISLRQPWATAVAYFGKDVENRSNWPFKYRGPILVHASASKGDYENYLWLHDLLKAAGLDEPILAAVNPDGEGPAPLLFPHGAIVAVANLAEVFGPDEEVPEGHPVEESPYARDDANYWLYLSDVTPVQPVPFKGAVGMFKVPYAVAAALEEDPEVDD